MKTGIINLLVNELEFVVCNNFFHYEVYLVMTHLIGRVMINVKVNVKLKVNLSMCFN